MKHAKCLLSIGLVLGLLAASGCGKQDEQTTRFNKTLGDSTAGVPTAPATIDTGILQDPANYKPANYEPLVEKAGGPGASSGGSPEADAILGVISELGLSFSEMDIEGVLDSFVPEQVAAYRGEDDYLSNFDEMSDVVKSFFQLLEEKVAAPEGETTDESTEETAIGEEQVLEALGKYIAVTVLDEENAVATLELSRIEIPEEAKAQLLQSIQQMTAAMAQLNAGGPGGESRGERRAGNERPAPTPAPAFTAEKLDEFLSSQIPIPMRKVEGEWRIVLPFTITEELADLLNDAVLIVTDFMRDFRQACDQAEALDEQTIKMLAIQVVMRQTGPIMGFFGKAKPIITSLQETMATKAEAGKTGQDEEP